MENTRGQIKRCTLLREKEMEKNACIYISYIKNNLFTFNEKNL